MERHLGQLVQAANVLARSVFDELDPQLDPRVVLAALPLGVPAVGGVRIVAAHDDDAAADLSEALRESLGRAPGAAADFGVEGARRRIAEAAAAADSARAWTPFVSTGRLLGAHVIHVLLRLRRPVHDSYYALKRRRTAEGRRLAGSLLEATVREFLVAAAAGVAESGSEKEPVVLPRTADEVVRSAGRVLMQTPAIAAGNGVGAHTFFQTCHRISAMRYEGHEGSGRLIVAEPGHSNVEMELAFHTPIDLHDLRGVRKVLELTGDGLALLSDSARLHGLGRGFGVYERSSENLFEVWFHSHAAWELAHGDAVLMSVRDGMPRLPLGEIDEDDFSRVLGEVFDHLDATRFDRLWQITIEAVRQRRGTTVVISSEAEAEAVRLGQQALRLEPVPLTPDRVPMLTAIDGAVLIDLDGLCHAVGVILDGKASRRGDPARGARFNSAVCYVEASAPPCVAIVISEEGSVDLVRSLA